MENDNPMRRLVIEKVTLNVGVGEPGDKMEKIKNLVEKISGTKAVKTTTKKRIPAWDIRPGLEIGVMTTLRGKSAEELLGRLMTGVENGIKSSNFDNNGNLSFGISEYVHIPGVKYDYTVGIVGLSVSVTMKRPGFSISKKRIARKVGKTHRIHKEEAIQFIKDKYRIGIGD